MIYCCVSCHIKNNCLMKTIKILFTILAVMLFANNSYAELTKVASADLTAYPSTEHSTRLAISAINGAGLNAEAGTHSTSSGDMWSSYGFETGIDYQYFKIKINTARDLDSIHIWNGNWGTTYRNRGVKKFEIYYAQSAANLSSVAFTDAQWTLLRSDSLEMASGATSYAGEGKSLTDIPSNVNWIALKITDHHGGGLSYVMLSEIQLFETPSEVENLEGSILAPEQAESGAQTDISFVLKGTAPWKLTYSLNGLATTVSDINSSPYTISETLAERTMVKIDSLSDANDTIVNADSTLINIYDTTVNPTNDGMVRESASDTYTITYIELKNATPYSREGVFSFDIADLDSMNYAAFKVYLYYASDASFSSTFSIYGIGQSEYDGGNASWADIQSYEHIDSSMSVAVTEANLNQYLTFDVTEYINGCIANGDTKLNFLLKASPSSVMYKLKMTENGSSMPELIYDEYNTGVTVFEEAIESKDAIAVYPNPATSYLKVTGACDIEQVSLYNLSGQCVMSSAVVNDEINIASLKSGSYILRLVSEGQVFVRKFIKE